MSKEKTKSNVKENKSKVALNGATSLGNKTGSWRYQKPVWDKKKCIQCMMCFNACPDCAITSLNIGQNIIRAETNLDYCKGCGICSQICPVKCIKMEKE
ncbi:MAG: 4Fe-4S dicluster-binding protein [archaeon]